MTTSLIDRCQDLWNRARQAPAQPPIRGMIPPSRVQHDRPFPGVFEPEKFYFQVRINELFLANGREWYRTYDPMVIVLSEFQYGRQVEAVPFIVGPAMLERAGITQLPVGMIFADTRVAGLHPYRGGRLNLTVILCRASRQNYARQLLSTLEGVAGAFDFSAALGSYLKLGKVVVDGVEQLMGQGDSQPLVGMRREFDPDAGQPVTESFHVIINAPEGSINFEHLWVLNGRLFIAAPDGPAQPFRAADYVLYSLIGTGARTDLPILPFYGLWDKVKGEASRPGDDAWRSAKAHMVALYQDMATSPDLTPVHARAVLEQFKAEMQSIHDSAGAVVSFDIGSPPPADDPGAPDPAVRDASLELLDLP